MADNGSKSLSMLLGNGDGTFQAPMNLSSGEPNFVVAGDFNADGKADLAVSSCHRTSHNYPCSIQILLGNGDGTFQYLAAFDSRFPSALAVADINGDGKLDLVLAETSIRILLGNGDGSFQPAETYDVGGNAGNRYHLSVAVADFNGDGVPDIAVGVDSMVAFLLGTGNGAFTLQSTEYLVGGSQPLPMAAADFNGDGKLDLAVANGAINKGVLLTNTTQ